MLSKSSILVTLERYAEGLDCLNKVLKLNPSLPEALYNKGNVLGNLERYYEAVCFFDEAIEKRPEYESAFLAKAVTLSCLGKHEEAFNVLMEAYMLIKNGDSTRSMFS